MMQTKYEVGKKGKNTRVTESHTIKPRKEVTLL